VAATFLGFHGRHKAQELLGGDLGFVQTVAALGLPAPAMFAALAVATQLGAGLCLLLGAATRPAALALAVTMVFAIAEKWPLGFLAIEPALTYLTICVVLTVTGAGARSVDTRLEPFVRGWIGRRLRRSHTCGSASACRPFCSSVASSRARPGYGRRAQSHVSRSDALYNPARVAIQTEPGDAATFRRLPARRAARVWATTPTARAC
jgi:putative oxidoreductase